jgi:hypothetical protein
MRDIGCMDGGQRAASLTFTMVLPALVHAWRLDGDGERIGWPRPD